MKRGFLLFLALAVFCAIMPEYKALAASPIAWSQSSVTYTKGSEQVITVTTNVPFVTVTPTGIAGNGTAYTLSGNNTLTFKPEFLDTLAYDSTATVLAVAADNTASLLTLNIVKGTPIVTYHGTRELVNPNYINIDFHSSEDLVFTSTLPITTVGLWNSPRWADDNTNITYSADRKTITIKVDSRMRSMWPEANNGNTWHFWTGDGTAGTWGFTTGWGAYSTAWNGITDGNPTYDYIYTIGHTTQLSVTFNMPVTPVDGGIIPASAMSLSADRKTINISSSWMNANATSGEWWPWLKYRQDDGSYYGITFPAMNPGWSEYRDNWYTVGSYVPPKIGAFSQARDRLIQNYPSVFSLTADKKNVNVDVNALETWIQQNPVGNTGLSFNTYLNSSSNSIIYHYMYISMTTIQLRPGSGTYSLGYGTNLPFQADRPFVVTSTDIPGANISSLVSVSGNNGTINGTYLDSLNPAKGTYHINIRDTRYNTTNQYTLVITKSPVIKSPQQNNMNTTYKLGSGTPISYDVLSSGDNLTGVIVTGTYPQLSDPQKVIKQSPWPGTGTHFDIDTTQLDKLPSGTVVTIRCVPANSALDDAYVRITVYGNMTLSPTSGNYTKLSNTNLVTTATNPIASYTISPAGTPNGFMSVDFTNQKTVTFNSTVMDNMNAGAYTVTFTDIYGQTATYTANITRQLTISPETISYKKGSGTAIVITDTTPGGDTLGTLEVQAPYSQSAVASKTSTTFTMSTAYLDTLPNGSVVQVKVNSSNGYTAPTMATITVYDSLTVTPPTQTYYKTSGTVLKFASNNPIGGLSITGPDNPPASWVQTDPTNPNGRLLNPSVLDTLTAGTYTIKVTDIYGQNGTSTLIISNAAPFVINPTSGTYKLNSGDILKIQATAPNIVKSVDVPAASGTNKDNIIKSLQAYIGSSYMEFDTSFLDQVGVGTYSIVLTDNFNQTKTYSLTIQPPPLTLSSDEGTYTQQSGITISVSSTSAGNFASVDRPFVTIDSTNKKLATFNSTAMDTLPVGVQTVTFVDSYGSTATYTLMVLPPATPSGFSPNNGTYIVGSGTPLSTTASMGIKTITSDKLTSADYTVTGKLLTFTPSRLDGLSSGTYTVKAILLDNSVIQYDLKIINNTVVTDRCTVNAYSFNKNTNSSEYQDYEITCSVPILSVQKLVFGSKTVPTSDYFVVGTSLVVDKDWIAQLADNQYRISFDYNSGRGVIFYLDVSSEVVEEETDAEVPC